MDIETIDKIKKILFDTYPDAACALSFHSPFELLIATILSAQCTDKRVNLITAELFAHANTPELMCSLGEDNIKEIIKSCGLANAKAKNIYAASQMLCREYDGVVPSELPELMRLPGVGRKTALVVRAEAFAIPAFAVDTHVGRVSVRIGLAKGKTPEKIEAELMQTFPEADWIALHHILITHGRNICSARSPRCEICPIRSLCERNELPPRES